MYGRQESDIESATSPPGTRPTAHASTATRMSRGAAVRGTHASHAPSSSSAGYGTNHRRKTAAGWAGPE
eukprot:10822814-Lingulodinium_polyedra.AAC.1